MKQKFYRTLSRIQDWLTDTHRQKTFDRVIILWGLMMLWIISSIIWDIVSRLGG